MRLLYCIPSLYESGGTERIVTQKINFLLDVANEQYDIIVVTTEGLDKRSFYPLHPKVKVIELNINFLEEFNKPLLSKYIGTKRKLTEYSIKLSNIIKNHKVDICISTGAKELEFLADLKVPCKKICELHFSKNNRRLFLEKKNGVIWKILGNMRTAQLIKQTKKLDKLVVLTKKDEIDWKNTNRNVLQIYNFSNFQTDDLAKLDNKKVIAVGRLTDQKGYPFLIDAWQIVNEKNKEWSLEIYGEGDIRDKLIEQIKCKNLDDTIFLMGQTQEVQNKIVESSIFALSSKYEGFPMVLLESMACGVPVVSFDCETGPSEIIEDNDCGILVENRNVEKLADALMLMITDKELRKIKGENAKRKSEKFSKEQIMNQWRKLFESLMKIN